MRSGPVKTGSMQNLENRRWALHVAGLRHSGKQRSLHAAGFTHPASGVDPSC